VKTITAFLTRPVEVAALNRPQFSIHGCQNSGLAIIVAKQLLISILINLEQVSLLVDHEDVGLRALHRQDVFELAVRPSLSPLQSAWIGFIEGALFNRP